MFESHPEAFLDFLRTQEFGADAFSLITHEHARTGRPPAELVLAAGLVTPNGLLRAVARHCGCVCACESIAPPVEAALGRLPAPLARRHRAVPCATEGEVLVVYLDDPFDPRLTATLENAVGGPVRGVLVDEAVMDDLLGRHYSNEELSPAREAANGAPTRSPETQPALSAASFSAAEVVPWLDGLLRQAVRERASDVHFEPFEDSFGVRFRVDGTLRSVATPATALAVPVISRLKVMADLNIAERRVPQDGRMRLDVDGRTVDLRISTLPTQFGESVVLRVLDGEGSRLRLHELGLPPAILAGLAEAIQRPNGLLLVTGPTGSGKTTTLYSALRTLNSTERKLLTVEDPVEYELDGVMQVGVHASIGRTFGSTLRALLRQDPDVVLVGEIRDEETARVAVQAALTGHLVMATLHTNDAAGAVVRLADMGIESYLIAASLSGVLAQRLLRRICPSCRLRRALTASERKSLTADGCETLPDHVHEAAGCAQCGQIGYRGRLGLYEWLPITSALRDLIAAGATTQALRAQAKADGRETLRQAGLRALAQADTSVEEVLMYT